VMHCLDQFCQASGQKINNQKTQKKILQTCWPTAQRWHLVTYRIHTGW
jgi:hypothetical protein